MLTKYHITIGAIASIILYLIFQLTPLQTLIIFLASFLIDVDHYLYYIFHKKNLSLKNAHHWFIEKRKKWVKLTRKQKEEHKHVIIIFHGIEYLIILIFLSFYNPVFTFIIIGTLIHLVLDYIDLYYHKEKLHSKFSQIYTYIKNKNKNKFLI
ncbi:hypothetical protein HOE04_02635 [archaeon]|jgi:hypothetical protein|nr:hypothetical protein [archaeon]